MKLIHNEEKRRFDLYDDTAAHVGKIEYLRDKKGDLLATHTRVHKEFEGKGYAGQLLDALAEYAAAQKVKIVPVCPYVKKVFERCPEKYAAVFSPALPPEENKAQG